MTNLYFPRNSTTYKIYGTNTIRLSSEAILSRWGTNLQNIEKEMRGIYIPDGWPKITEALIEKFIYYLQTRDISIFTEEERVYGRILVQVDQSGAEALIVAYLCNPGKFRDLFLNKIKPHVFIGLAFPHHWEKQYPQVYEIGKLQISEITKHIGWKELRQAIVDSDNNPPGTRYYYHYKQTCHSSNYDIKAPTFILNMLEKSRGKVVLTRQQGEMYLSGYHTLFPEIREWHIETREILHATKTLYNLQGFPRYFGGILNESMYKEAYAFVPQSTVGVITHVAYTNLQNYIEDNQLQWDLLANTHDSYMAQCPIGDELECAKVMKQFIEQDLISPRGEAFKMRSEAQCGFNWGPAKPKKNKWGLVEVNV